MMSAVVYDVGYDTRMLKTRKNMVTVRLLAAIKEKNRSPKQYQYFEAHCHIYISSEYRKLRHTIPLTTSSTTVSNLF